MEVSAVSGDFFLSEFDYVEVKLELLAPLSSEEYKTSSCE
jgi:hypothetical protein